MAENKPAPEDNNVTDLVEEGKNRLKVTCPCCDCAILVPKAATFIQKEQEIPHMKKTENPGDTELINDFWMVQDMFHFENIGFLKAVKNMKYLICADCEVGPLGWHDTNDKKAFYIALSRVNHR